MTSQSCLFYEKIGDFWLKILTSASFGFSSHSDTVKEAAYKSEHLCQKSWALQAHNIRYECKTLC